MTRLVIGMFLLSAVLNWYAADRRGAGLLLWLAGLTALLAR